LIKCGEKLHKEDLKIGTNNMKDFMKNMQQFSKTSGEEMSKPCCGCGMHGNESMLKSFSEGMEPHEEDYEEDED
jgi:hypothetical protein